VRSLAQISEGRSETVRHDGHLHPANHRREGHIGQYAAPRAGNNMSVPAIRGSALKSTTAAGDSGTRCSRPIFIRFPGTVQTAAFRLISAQVAPLTSPDP
jgi:hypothetical protein